MERLFHFLLPPSTFILHHANHFGIRRVPSFTTNNREKLREPRHRPGLRREEVSGDPPRRSGSHHIPTFTSGERKCHAEEESVP